MQRRPNPRGDSVGERAAARRRGAARFVPFGQAVAAALLAALLGRHVPSLELAENWTYDLRVALLSAPVAQDERIVVVLVEEETLTRFPYRSPLDRSFLAALLRDLEAKGARLVGLDILLDQPTEPAKDRELSDTLNALSIPVVAASGTQVEGFTERQAQFLSIYLRGLRTGIPQVLEDPHDGTVRDLFLGDRSSPSLVAALAALAGAARPGREDVPLAYRARIHDAGASFLAVPAHVVSALPATWFAGKVVLIGADLSLLDRHRTPLTAVGRGLMLGALIQAHGLSQLLDQRRIRVLGSWWSGFGVLLCCLVATAIARAPLRTLGFVALSTGALVAVWGLALLGYRYAGTMLPMVAPGIGFVLAASMTHVHLRVRERRERVHLRRAFEHYLPPPVIDAIVADPSQLRLGGEMREVSFVFTDISDFTALTERLGPERLVEIMNAYFDGVCALVLEHGGTIDKFVGDAVHAMFNAPIRQPDHAERAVRCALALAEFGERFAATQAARGIAFGRTRIGVNSGPAIVGNFGGPSHFDYTAYGTSINTAARLEAASKDYPVRVCASEATADLAPGVVFRPIDRIRLRGVATSTTILEPIDEAEAKCTDLDGYRAAYALRERDREAASVAFALLARRFPDDKLIAWHASKPLELPTASPRDVSPDRGSGRS